MVEFESSSLLAAPTASEEASVSSSGEPMMILPPPQVPTAEKKKRNLPGMPDPDAEVIALSPKSLLATNRFICEICSKGFQRQQNLQLHRRCHNLPWKLLQRTGTEVRKWVYVCPEPTCVHHDPKRALGDLTQIKKHFCRKHGEKKWKCERCAKKYAVQSDWKAHMKTCGIREYRCDCGTLFSRRDSFIAHRAFCDALAQESARSAETLAITHPDGDLKIQTVVAASSSSSSPLPPPLTPSTSALSPVLSIQSSGIRTPNKQNSSKPDIFWKELYSDIVRKRQKLSLEDKESLGRDSDEVSHSYEEELMEEMWSEELEETSSDSRELEELNCYPMDVPPTVSHHFSILHVLDLSYTEINSLPQSISRLVALQKLYLRNCERLMQLPPEIGELTNLEGTEIVCLPKEIANLYKLTCLRVSFYGYANQTVIPRKVLSNLSRLNELIIDVTPYGEWWDVEVEAIIDDLRSLKELRALKLYLPTAKLLEELTLIFPGLANFRFTVGQCEEHFISRLPRDNEEEFNNWEKLEKGLKYVNGDRLPNEIIKVFKHVNAFFLQCHWTANSLSEFGHENLNEVKFCLVMECNEFRTIIDSKQFYQGNDGRAKSEYFQDFDEAIVLGSLERLIVRYMKNMESIWKGPVGKGSMSSLKSLALHTCPNLTTLFTIDMLSNLINLEELIVEDCPKIDSLVSLKNSGSKSGLFLPSLKKISLLELPGLVSISSGLCIAPKLERMVIFYCPKLEKLSTRDISSTNLKAIKGEEEWWNALKWYESDLSTEHEDYLTSLFIPLRRNGDLFAQLTED